MCGRLVLVSPTDQLVEEFSIVDRPNLAPRYNIAPTTPILVIEGETRCVVHMRWGLIPAWVKDPAKFTLLINARSETVAEKPSFRTAFKRRRCIVPADGFYEWRRADGSKQPFYVSRADGRLMAIAGIWETWTGPDGEEMDSVAVLTTAANDDVASVHDRMPVVLEREDYQRWLATPELEVAQLADLLEPSPDGTLALRAVSTLVNAVRNDDPRLLEPIETGDQTVADALESIGQAETVGEQNATEEPAAKQASGQLDLF